MASNTFNPDNYLKDKDGYILPDEIEKTENGEINQGYLYNSALALSRKLQNLDSVRATIAPNDFSTIIENELLDIRKTKNIPTDDLTDQTVWIQTD